jgi:hypothetical protein
MAHRTYRREKSFQVTPGGRTSFQSLKQTMYTASILGYLWPGKKFIIDMDGSNAGIKRVLPQMQDRQEQVLVYYNKTLNRLKLLCHTVGAAGHCEDTGTLP